MTNPTPAQHHRATEITNEICHLGLRPPRLGRAALHHLRDPRLPLPRRPPRPHGPYTSWTRKVAGKTVTRRLSAEQHAQYEPWFQAHRRLRELLGELEALSLEIIESELRPATGPNKPNPRPRQKTPAT